MIVQAAGSSLFLIRQPDHAALAREVMEHWTADDFPGTSRRDSLMHAIQEHDNGWRELDASPIVDVSSGQILDFITAPAEVRQSVWPRGVGRLADDPWAAALVAQHAVHVYGRNRSVASWTPFFAAMEALRDRHVEAAGQTLNVLFADYLFLRVADLISLAFCNAWTDEQRHEQYVIGSDGSHLTIAPDPFDGATVPLSVHARVLPHRRFAGSADAEAAFVNAPELLLSGTISA
jgi:hypothetical protein